MATELRKTGIVAVGDMSWGTHFCSFYETKQDLLDILIPYFKTGLENNEFCLWVISEPLTAEEAESALRQAVPDFDRCLADRSMEIVSSRDWYLQGGSFDKERVINCWDERLERALAGEYAGMRVSGSEAWVTKEDWKSFSKYEKELNESIGDKRMIALCTYPLISIGAAEIMDAAHTHQFTAAMRNGNWELFETFELKQAKAEIKRLNEELEQRVDERTTELEEANKELRREIAERKVAEELLKKQKEILQKIFDHIPAMISLYDENGQLKMVNQEWERTIGWTLEEIGEANLDLIAECFPDPKEREYVWNFFTAANSEWADFKPKVRSGRVVDTTWARVRLSDGASISIGQDITERKRVEEALRATSEQLRALSASLNSAREEEGTRIARELHDELGAALTSLKWGLEDIDKLYSEAGNQKDPSKLRETIEIMMGMIDAAIDTVKKISSELRPVILDDLGLVAAIEWQAQQFENRTGIICQFDSFVDNIDLSRDQATAVFRIFQEALTNILRHAQADIVNIMMEEADGDFVLEVEDNGRGIAEDEIKGPKSLGLIGMRERAHLVGGRVEIAGAEGKGTALVVRVPIQSKASN